MKKIISLILMLCFLTLSVNAQEKNNIFGGWAAPTAKFTTLGDKNPFSKNSDFAFLLTLRGGFLLNNFIIGSSGSILISPISYDCKKAGVSYEDYPDEDSDGWGPEGTEACNDFRNPELDFFYVGIFFGYDFQVTKIFKIEILDFIGFGSMNGGDYEFLDGGETYDQDFFIMEPEISFLFVIKKFFAISLNMSYRIPAMLDNEHDHYSSWDISGPSMEFDLRFGYFKYKDSP